GYEINARDGNRDDRIISARTIAKACADASEAGFADLGRRASIRHDREAALRRTVLESGSRAGLLSTSRLQGEGSEDDGRTGQSAGRFTDRLPVCARAPRSPAHE